MDREAVYQKQKFGQKIGLGRAPALLVVDFVNGFADPEMFGGGNIRDAIAATMPLLDFGRSKGIPIAFTRIVYADDGSDAGIWCRKAPRLRELTENSPASHVVDDLKPRQGEMIMRKTQASSFFGTGLAPSLILAGIDTVLITGCTTSGCVRATVVDAISLNFRPIVVSDCVGDRALEPHDANLFDIGQKYADLLTAEEVMAELG